MGIASIASGHADESRANVEQIHQLANEMRTQANNYSEQLEASLKDLTISTNTWSGAAQVAFDTQKEAHAVRLRAFVTELNAYATVLDRAADTYYTADVASSEAISNILG